jgi:ubiquinol-cytochrome c reductase cytochrome c1 subunit
MRLMLRRLAGAALLAVTFAAGAHAAESNTGPTAHYPINQPRHVNWSFSGPFGKFDPQQLQRGLQIYREVCSACHALSYVAFRNLSAEGGPNYTAAQAAALAAEYQISDGPDANGDMFQRPGRASDRFPSPFANEQAARASNNGAYPPDLSLVAKARAIERGFPTFIFDIFTQYQEIGPNYIYSLLTGYQDPPPGVQIREGQHYNPYFISGPALAMPPPLTANDQIQYAQNQDDDPNNNVPQTVDQYAKDVAAFLMWAAEPHMMQRKQMGLYVMAFLIVFAGLVYYTKRKIWADQH